ncbi:phage minor capsid protein [Nocardia puris]|uniref:phage minor capsid protein n=1 Tax=Nocardia puris TaxID=208602 RepID=UPI002E242D21
MAYEPAAVDGLQDTVAQIYADAEVQLLARVAAAIERGIDSPEWVTTQLAEISRLSAESRGFLLQLDPVVAQQIQDALVGAHAAGVAGADEDIPGAPSTAPAPVISQEAVAALAAETTAAVLSTHTQILRSTVDGYREVVAEVSGRVVTGVATRREVTQQALDSFAARGITSFRDRAGRRWHMDTYAEMAVRTAALRALKAGHTDRLLQRGYDVVVISSHPRAAPQCRPFEGKLVSLTGRTPTGPIQAESRTTGRTVSDTVVASMAEAETAGLHHPNCKHAHSLWVPGAPRPKVEPHDPQGYRDEQKLRRLERAVREAKRQQAAAITPEAKTKAGAKLRARQAAIRDHVAQTGVPRRRHREQLRTGNPGNAVEPVRLTRTPPPAPQPAPTAQKPRTVREFKNLTDEDLEERIIKAVEDVDLDLLDRLEAEDLHRRRLAKKREERWAGYERKYDELIGQGVDHETAVERAYGISVKMQRQQAAVEFLRGQGYSGKSFAELARHAHKDQAYQHWLAAEEATNGYMLSRAGERAGVDPRTLWFGNAATAERYASEELRAYWDLHGRPTFDEFKAELLDPQSAARMRSARGDFLR